MDAPARPMRVVYLNTDQGIPVLGEKGASVHVRSFVTALSALGHDVALCCTRVGDGNAPPPGHLLELPTQVSEADLAAERLRLGIVGDGIEDPVQMDDVLRREVKRIALDRLLPGRVASALRETGFAPDLIYERHALFHTAGVELASALGVPRLLEVNAPLVEEQARYRGLRLRSEAEAAERQSFHGADLVIAVSDAVREHVLSQGVDERRLMVEPNGVDTALFRATHGAGDAVRARWELEDKVVIGFVGSFKAWHGMDFLLDAFALIAPRYPSARLLAVGNGPMLEAARARVVREGLADRVTFTGDIPHVEVPAHLAAMDMTVAPYLAQPGFYFSPLKIVESLAAARPVVAPRLGQIENLIVDGETGLLYPPDDLAACVTHITKLLGDAALRLKMGQRAANQAQRDWDWTRVGERVLMRGATVNALGALV